MAKLYQLTDRDVFRRILVRAIAIPIVIMVILIGLFWLQLNEVLSATQWVDHTDQVLSQAYNVKGYLIDMETGVRGYLLTGSQQFLDPYKQGLPALQTTFDNLQQLVSDNPTQSARLATMRTGAAQWESFAQSNILYRDNGGVFNTVDLQLQGKQMMDNLRSQINTFTQTEIGLRDTRSHNVQATTNTVLASGVGIGVLLAILLGVFTTQQLIGISRRYGNALDAVNKQAEEVFKQREWLQGTLSSIGDAVIATDVDGTISFINEVAQTLIGCPPNECIGRPLASVFKLRNAVTHAPVDDPLAEVIRTGAVVNLADQTVLVNHDNQEIPIDDSAAPIRDAEKKLFGVVLVFRDITERKRAEAEQRASDIRYRDLADSVPSIVWTAQPDGAHDYFNRRWFDYTGMSTDQSIGSGWQAALHPDDVQRSVERWHTALQNREGYDLESRWKAAADNGFSWHLERTTPVRSEDGQLTSWVGTLTNIDSQKHTELMLADRSQELERTAQRLEERNAELDQFAYVTSHDLKAPLRGIANLSQWIEEDLGANASEEIHKQMELLRGRVHRMEGLIEGVLQYSRVGRVKSAIVMVDLNVMFATVIDLLAVPPGFTVSVQPDLPSLKADQVRLQQVASNLIGNAIKHHASSEGHVWVSLTDSGAYYEFVIADDGPGIAPEYHQKIFVIFQTLESRDKVEGSGLGLALVKKIVEDQGGRIWVDSAVGAGSKFHFTWPKRPKEVV